MCPDTGYRQISGQSPHGRFRLLLTEPADCEILRLPADCAGGYDPGIPVEIESADGRVTVATFKGGYGYETTAFAGPGETHFTLINGGTGYSVPYADPAKAVRLPADPVRFMKLMFEGQLLVLADWTDVCAMDGKGRLWRSVELGYDDVEITHIDEDEIVGTALDVHTDTQVKFTLDTKSGRIKSGGVFAAPHCTPNPYWHRDLDEPK